MPTFLLLLFLSFLLCISCKIDVVLWQRKGRQQKEMTLEDMYNQGDYDDDDDDSDWEPIQKHMEIRKWFCINCTVPNFDNDVYCYVCNLLQSPSGSSIISTLFLLYCGAFFIYFHFLYMAYIFYLSIFCNSYLVWIFSPIYNLQICGEHKESGILRHGFFASPISQEADLREEELELAQRSKGGLLVGLFERFSCSTIVAINKL